MKHTPPRKQTFDQRVAALKQALMAGEYLRASQAAWLTLNPLDGCWMASAEEEEAEQARLLVQWADGPHGVAAIRQRVCVTRASLLRPNMFGAATELEWMLARRLAFYHHMAKDLQQRARRCCDAAEIFDANRYYRMVKAFQQKCKAALAMVYAYRASIVPEGPERRSLLKLEHAARRAEGRARRSKRKAKLQNRRPGSGPWEWVWELTNAAGKAPLNWRLDD